VSLLRGKKKIVLLGMMSQMPVAGNVWLVLQYLLGFERLGYDVFYVESHGSTPRELMRSKEDDGPANAAAFIDRMLRRFGLGDRWAYHAVRRDGRCYGMSEAQLRELYRTADLILNLHGGTRPLPEHSATGRLVYLSTDPVDVEVELYDGVEETIDFLAAHCAFFTWGLNYGNPDCRVPVSDRFLFRPLPPPILLDLWQRPAGEAGDTFTTVGNWRQLHREVRFQGEAYTWSKHTEFLKILDLPARAGRRFELALGSYGDADRELLEENGWRVRPACEVSADLDAYRCYLAASCGELTVAKDQNVRLRSGWFSERSVQYLATGRPVITQETGFSNVLPTGAGLFAFSTPSPMDEIVAAVGSIDADFEHHSRAAAEIAGDCFDYQVVLPKLLAEVGV
jgi:hypothetical protein